MSHSRSSVQKVFNRYNRGNRVENAPSTGPQPKLNDSDKRNILRTVKENAFVSCRKISDDLAIYDKKRVSVEILRRAVVENGFSSRMPRKKPLVSSTSKEKCITFAKTYCDKPVEFWDEMLFSDEYMFRIFDVNGYKRVWRGEREALNSKNTVKSPIKHRSCGVMVWGSIAASCVKIFVCENIMDQNSYLDILRNKKKQNALRILLQEDFLF